MKWTLIAAVALCVACQSSPKPRPAPAVADGPISLGELEEARIADIEIRGLHEVSESAIRSAVGSESGAAIDRAQLRADLRAVMAIPGIADAKVEAVRVGDGIGIVFVVTEAPRIAGIEVEGNAAIPDAVVIEVANLRIGSRLDPLAVRDAATALRRRYRLAGYYRAVVDWKTASPGDGAIVTFAVDEGPKVTIKRISFPGAKVIAVDALAKLLSGSPQTNSVGKPLDDEEVGVATLRILADYYDRGYVNARVGPHVIKELESNEIELEIPIAEGDQFRLGKLRVSGTLAAPAADYLGEIKSQTGDVFSRSLLGSDIQRLAAFHERRSGRRDVVTPRTTIDVDTRIIDIDLEISTQ